ncbi:hypothetical protein VPH35_127740 [Triticum aestivum]
MERPTSWRLLASHAGLIPFLILWSTAGSSVVAAALVPIPVGVSLACISMALEDFYLKNPSYTTRVELHRKGSRGELATAVYAVEELMNKAAQVQAIISPHTTSPEVELFTSMTKRTDIPILSLSTTAPASGSSLARSVVRTAANSTSEATPIAAIIEAFAILPALIHAIQLGRGGHAARDVTDCVAVPADATYRHLDEALLALRNMPARVYVVHMSPALAGRLFRRAMVAGMMSEGYVWIATATVGNPADSLNRGNVDCMQGVVIARPYVQATDQVRSFYRRLKVRFRQQSLASDDDDTVHGDQSAPVWLLWLYDTAWAAAAAAEVSFRTARPITFLDALLVAKFDGLAGRFRLVDGQLQVSAYEIVNIIGNGERTVGFWTPELGISTSLNPRFGNKLKQVLWPGETAAVPIGWSESPGGRPLRVAVPVKRGFSQFRVKGYCIDVFYGVMAKLNYPSYEALVNLVRDKKADAVVGDVTITSSRMKQVSFTMPFADTGWSMIVAEQDNLNSNSMWIFVKPLTPELWFTSLAFFISTGFVVWAIEHRINPRFRGTRSNQLGVVFYFLHSELFVAEMDVSQERLKSNLSKLVVIMWVFAVLILTTSYMANLTTILTVRQLQPAINDLRESDYMGSDDARFRRYTTMDQYTDALKKGSDNGGLRHWVPYLRLFLSRYCEGYSMVGPTYKSGGFGFVFPMGSPLAVDVSRAILELAEEDNLSRIENKWFSHPGACMGRFRGLFLINAVVSCLMLLVHLARFPTRPTAGALPWLRAWLRRFDAFEGPRDEPLSNGQGTVEVNRLQGVAAEAADRQAGAAGDSDSTPVGDTDSGRNAASAPVSEESSGPVGGSSTGQSPHESAQPALAPM